MPVSQWLGKLIGALAGYLALGFWGLPLGLWIGHLFDRGLSGVAPHVAAISKTRERFFRSVFSVMGHLCKADGRISEMEIRAAEQIIAQLGLSAEQRNHAIREFNRGKAEDFDLDAEIAALHNACRIQPNLYRIFLEIQMQAVMADGQIQAKERELLLTIAKQLGLSRIELAQLEGLLRGARSQHDPNISGQNRLQAAYELLGVTEKSTASEIKKAYRRLMSQHHPDKLAAKGLPPEMAKMATEKTQEIRTAYDLIREARGIS